MTSQYIKQNSTLLSMPNDKFIELMSAVLQNGTSFRFQASGFSMSPLIRDGDVLTLAHPSIRRIRLGDVVAFINLECAKLTIHRVVGARMDQYLIKADNGREPDGWISKKEILGHVTRVEHLNRSVHVGLGPERRLIALLSRYNLLVPCIRVFWPLLRTFYNENV